MGATLLDNLVGSPVEIPKQTGGATAYWVGENEPLTGSDQTLGQLQLTPKLVGALVELSNIKATPVGWSSLRWKNYLPLPAPTELKFPW